MSLPRIKWNSEKSLSLSTLSNKKSGTKVKYFFRGEGNDTHQIWVRFWAYTRCFWTNMKKSIWQRYKNLFNIILVWYSSKGTRWAIKNRIKSSFMVAFVTFYKINSKWAKALVWTSFHLVLQVRLVQLRYQRRTLGGCCGFWSYFNFNLKLPQ